MADKKLRILVPLNKDDPPPPPYVRDPPSASDHERLNALERVLKHSVGTMLHSEFPKISDKVDELVFHPPFPLPEERKGLSLDTIFEEEEAGVNDEVVDKMQNISKSYTSFLATLAKMIPTNPTVPNEEYHTEKRVLETVSGNVVAVHKREYFFAVKTDNLLAIDTFPHALWIIREGGGNDGTMIVTMIAIHATTMMSGSADGEEMLADEIQMYGMRGTWHELAMEMKNESPMKVGGSPFRISHSDDTPILAVKRHTNTKGMWSQHGLPMPLVYVANYYASSIYKLKELLQKT